jgi:CheY-like chemotaxis protein
MMKTAAQAHTSRILLVDDNSDGLLVRKSVLAEQGHVVTACDSPDKALQVFTTNEFDLVVTDYRMPGMKGDELIRQMRAFRPSTPIVLVSGLVDVVGLNEKNTGADAVIAKNANEIAHMVRAVNHLLKRSIPRKPAQSQGATRSSKAASQ